MRFLMLFLVLCFSLPVSAQDAVPQSRAEITLTFAPIVKKAAPAVVNIFTRSRVQVQDGLTPFMNDPLFRQFFGEGFGFGGRTREKVISSLGSGVIVKPDGTIVTSYHVIKDAQQITVVLSDKRELEAKVTVKDPQADLAFLKVEAPEPLPSLEIRDSDTLEVGDLVLAIGNPFGVGQTVTNGIISGLARKAVGVSDYQFFIQTDAAINPGNSGGALVDMKGRLIGINTAIYSSSGGSNGIGFAIPANMVRSLLEGKVEGGRVVRPWLGADVQPVTAEMAESLGMKAPRGVIVKSTSGAQGLKVGDVILAFNAAPVDSEQDLQYRLALAKVGDTSQVTVWRNGKEETVPVTLEAPSENPKRDLRLIKGRNPLSGLTVANLSPALAMELNIGETQGVIVTRIEGGLGLETGIAPGDILVQVNGVKVTSTQQLESLMKKPLRQWQIIYRRGGNLLSLTVSM